MSVPKSNIRNGNYTARNELTTQYTIHLSVSLIVIIRRSKYCFACGQKKIGHTETEWWL